MILYQVVKWMEERSALLLVMKETSGTQLKALTEKRAAVEHNLLRQAERWLSGSYLLPRPEEELEPKKLNRDHALAAHHSINAQLSEGKPSGIPPWVISTESSSDSEAWWIHRDAVSSEAETFL